VTTPTVIIVGADKGGVGKTTVSRTLLDYLKANGRDYRAFDTETPTGVLKRFHSEKTEVIDLTTSDGQMKVFDTLSSTEFTVIDIYALVCCHRRSRHLVRLDF
jgi:cellulose biosynthesis protein BcsQ